MHGSLVTSSLIRETTEDESQNYGYKLNKKKRHTTLSLLTDISVDLSSNMRLLTTQEVFTSSSQYSSSLRMVNLNGYSASTTDWLKLNPLRLNAIVQIPIDVNHTQTTGNTARKK